MFSFFFNLKIDVQRFAIQRFVLESPSSAKIDLHPPHFINRANFSEHTLISSAHSEIIFA